ncbi:hypothetical protein DYD21_11180 [Rhodohalobacter sp. SW132]|uniref:hypothetical protein n=1 Tax=Rhodohalobacter sp. SW132 TaxID=2293433 RepID=UPI000E260C92|nr:hypothetical protein [Rhodohalobacter sp. SW132]REL33335.1 hypothetical protein DYD21_11180 [Rhodohalobacter sp. SW132]
MILRWIYILWNFLLKTAGYLLLFLVILAGFLLAAIQLPVSKDHLRVQLEDAFNQQFDGTAEVESIRGFIPFRTQFNNVVFYSPEYPYDQQFSADEMYVSVDLWELIRGNIEITSLQLDSPNALFSMGDDGLQLASIFSTGPPDSGESERSSRREASQFFNQFSIYAPEITISNGVITADESIQFPDRTGFSTPFVLSELNAQFFLDSDDQQQFLDITSMSASTNDPDFPKFSLNGQLFNDSHYLELNGFEFNSENINISLSAEGSPLHLFSEHFREQLASAEYLLDIQNFYVEPVLLHRFNPALSEIRQPVEFVGSAEGNLETLYLDNLQVTIGESSLLADGRLRNLMESDLDSDLAISNLVLSGNELQPFLAEAGLDDVDLTPYGYPTLRGSLSGTLNQVEADLTLETDLGSAELEGDLHFRDILTYSLQLGADSLDISPFFRDSANTTVLNGRITANGSGTDRFATVEAEADLSNSRIKNHPFALLTANLNMADQSGRYSIALQNDRTEGSASGNFQLGDSQQLNTEAVVQQLDITQYITDLPYESTLFSGRVSANVEGTSMDDLFGRISVEVSESIIDGDTLRPHQFYADINEGDGESRTLRLTSSFFDAELSGTIYPGLIRENASYWQNYLTERFQDELFFDDLIPEFPAVAPAERSFEHTGPMDLSLSASLKDLQLFRAYFPDLREIESTATVNLNINSTNDALSLNGSVFDDSLNVGNSVFNNIGVTFTAMVNHGESLRNNTVFDFQFNSPSMRIDDRYSIRGASLNMSLRDSILTVRQEIENALENLTYYSETTTTWYPNRLETTVDTLTTGSSAYQWQALGTPEIIYNRDGSLTLNEFNLESDEDYFEINGTFSDAPEDSVNYNIRNFSLGRVSDLIGGRIQFEGVVDGDFTTRALTQIPSIQGDITVLDGKINDRVIGDVSLRSRFNSESNRFDTELHLYTDPARYADYLEANDGIGHDLFFEGYFRAPDESDDDTEDLFYFDADLREIDMWIVTFIVPNVILEMEGSASGTGFIRGNRDDYDFEASFDVQDVYGRPFFTNVPYMLEGNLIFNRADGLLFDEVYMDDMEGGEGLLTGQIDLDDFSPITIFDLRLALDNLRFMNNVQDPNVPFYANLYGSGTAVFEGTNESPSIRSTTPIRLSSNSQISIPLQEETELEQDRRFIQFVESFEDLTPLQRRNGRGDSGSGSEEGEIDLTFVELFSMNLQFIADDPVNVRLIFDPVTNDILTATGTGQIRVILDDQDMSMFGRFNISGGEYQFVGGDIFTRRFTIQDGGSISWQGDLVDANLNVTASYRARPDISTLLPTGTSFQRVPIELILQIGGTISEIENDFYFQIPTGIEAPQDPTIAAQINRINQNEDEKVLQAFGILLTGNFVPTDELENPEFGHVTGTSALVNPLVSSQIISPLLSNQINSLLRSDITFDVDFNLNAFNEVDLGVALRLFNDRIVLRREGQITGDTEVGDIGATYRINRIFSVTAFHRQDPTLSNRAETEARQTQEMNGMGVEAQFQFNTWQSLRNRISNSFRNLFGLKEKEPEVEENDSDSMAQN